jgi:hypothetical protein
MTGLEQAFYIIGIIYMSLAILFLVGIIVVLIQAKRTVDKFQKDVTERMNSVANAAKGFIPAFIARKVIEWVARRREAKECE